MTTLDNFLATNREEIIEMAQEKMRDAGFEYVTLKEVLVKYKDICDMIYPISDTLDHVIEELKAENNKIYNLSVERIDEFRTAARGSKWSKR